MYIIIIVTNTILYYTNKIHYFEYMLLYIYIYTFLEKLCGINITRRFYMLLFDI